MNFSYGAFIFDAVVKLLLVFKSYSTVRAYKTRCGGLCKKCVYTFISNFLGYVFAKN